MWLGILLPFCVTLSHTFHIVYEENITVLYINQCKESKKAKGQVPYKFFMTTRIIILYVDIEIMKLLLKNLAIIKLDTFHKILHFERFHNTVIYMRLKYFNNPICVLTRKQKFTLFYLGTM